MDSVLQFLTDYGLFGMFLSSLLAGTVLPFSSEVVMVALAAAGVSPTALLITATLGNTLGGVINYWIGTLGKEEWLMRYLRTSHERLQKGIGYAHRYGYWSGLLAWVPILGSVISVALGYLRVNFTACLITFVVGKFTRYIILMGSYHLFT